jgi:hypothetical protein
MKSPKESVIQKSHEVAALVGMRGRRLALAFSVFTVLVDLSVFIG